MAGDFADAARHLRDALAHQEVELGRSHPDLASTLNNLGVVCERIGDDDEAERCYRRACEIVSAVFPPEHPFVETSRQNLAAFCESHHVPFERGAPIAAVESREEPPAPTLSPEPEVPTIVSPPRAAEPSPRRVRPATMAAAAIVVVVLAFWLVRSGRKDAGKTSSGAPVTTTAPTPAATATPAVTPTPVPPPSSPPTSAPPPPTPPPARAPARAPAQDAADAPVLVHAELCRTLTTGADWACAHPADPVAPGSIYFYTRLTAPRDTTVVHRWYRDDRLEQSRELQIHANLGPGYRTYSRITIDPGAAGQWRVELRTTDGRVLHEERFVVR